MTGLKTIYIIIYEWLDIIFHIIILILFNLNPNNIKQNKKRYIMLQSRDNIYCFGFYIGKKYITILRVTWNKITLFSSIINILYKFTFIRNQCYGIRSNLSYLIFRIYYYTRKKLLNILLKR